MSDNEKLLVGLPENLVWLRAFQTTLIVRIWLQVHRSERFSFVDFERYMEKH